jgi:hypothetical protein
MSGMIAADQILKRLRPAFQTNLSVRTEQFIHPFSTGFGTDLFSSEGLTNGLILSDRQMGIFSSWHPLKMKLIARELVRP